MLENSIEYLVASYALKKLNRVEVAVNRAFKGPSLARMINLTECDILITSSSHFAALKDIREALTSIQHLIVLDDCEQAEELFPNGQLFLSIPFRSQNNLISTARPKIPIQLIMFTSGTTGTSKGCILSHRYAVRTAENMISPYRLTENDRTYTPYPLSHIGPAFYDILPS